MKWANVKRYMPAYILFIPVFVYYIIFSYSPMVGMIIAFKDFSFRAGIFGSEWAGLKHFIRFMENSDFWRIFLNTIILSCIRLMFGFPAPIIFAILLNEIRSRNYKRIVQTISYLPHFVSWVVVSGLLFTIFSSDGLWNQLIMLLNPNAEPVSIMSQVRYFRTLFVSSAIWKELGWSAIIYIAALTSVDSELYEAAILDGANRWQKLWHVSLPGIRIVISTMFILSFANVLSVGFDQIVVMINTTNTSVAETIDYYVYRVGVRQINNYSYATAVGFFKSFISLGLVLLTNWGSKKIDEESGLW